MTYDDLISFYKTPAAAAAARGLDRQVVNGWRSRNRIPLDQQVEYEVLTGGALKADLPDEIRNPKSAQGSEQERGDKVAAQ